ncbi:serine/threonine protein phosphatase, partial [Sulfolobus sp. F3]
MSLIELDEIKSIVNKALEIFQSFESPFLGTIEVDGNVAFVGDT